MLAALYHAAWLAPGTPAMQLEQTNKTEWQLHSLVSAELVDPMGAAPVVATPDDRCRNTSSPSHQFFPLLALTLLVN